MWRVGPSIANGVSPSTVHAVNGMGSRYAIRFWEGPGFRERLEDPARRSLAIRYSLCDGAIFWIVFG
jgi:hypothetical protein